MYTPVGIHTKTEVVSDMVMLQEKGLLKKSSSKMVLHMGHFFTPIIFP